MTAVESADASRLAGAALPIGVLSAGTSEMAAALDRLAGEIDAVLVRAGVRHPMIDAGEWSSSGLGSLVDRAIDLLMNALASHYMVLHSGLDHYSSFTRAVLHDLEDPS